MAGQSYNLVRGTFEEFIFKTLDALGLKARKALVESKYITRKLGFPYGFANAAIN